MDLSLPFRDPHHKRPPLTKILATAGPATRDPNVVRGMIEAGVSAFRINFSHGELDEHERQIGVIRHIAEEMSRPIGILGDLQGPKVRIGKVVDGGVETRPGEEIVIQRVPLDQPAGGKANEPPVRFDATYEHIVDDVEVGHRVLINDGFVRGLVIDKTADQLVVAITHGGTISSGKGVNLPDSDLRMDTMSERDWEHVDWAIRHELDFLALSFVRRSEDVRQLRRGLRERMNRLDAECLPPLIMAKIETPQALRDIEAIVAVADGIMIARGDLGVEMDLAQVPVIQRRLIEIAHDHGKPSIVATQMLESMINAPTPTRAEVNDVATAIFDQANVVMLSGETAIGKYPVLTIETMVRVALQTEGFLFRERPGPRPPKRLVESRYHTAALAHGVWTISRDIDAVCIGIWSLHGDGARFLSQNSFQIPIVVATSDMRHARQMQLLRAVSPIPVLEPSGVSELTRRLDEIFRAQGWAEPGDAAIIVAREPLIAPGLTNALAIHIVGDPDSGFAHHNHPTRDA